MLVSLPEGPRWQSEQGLMIQDMVLHLTTPWRCAGGDISLHPHILHLACRAKHGRADARLSQHGTVTINFNPLHLAVSHSGAAGSVRRHALAALPEHPTGHEQRLGQKCMLQC